MDTKKRRGSIVSLRAYPYRQALALPPSKDKQLQACPRRITIIFTPRHNKPYAYIHQDSKPIDGVYTLINIYKGKDSRGRI